MLARPAAAATRACEPLISWCGNTRSLPPACTSKDGPRYSAAIAEHSTCQPGRPGPNRDSQDGLARPLRPPDQRVERVLLARPVRVAAALGRQLGHQLDRQVGEGAGPGQRAELLVGAAGEVDVAVDVVQRAAGGEPLGERVDDADGLHRADEVGRRQVPQRLHVAAVAVGLAQRELAPVLAVALGPLEQRVVHVGDVLGVDHLVPGVEPRADQQVPGGEGGGVAHVGRVVGGDAAGVQRRPVPGGRDGELPARRVPQPDFPTPRPGRTGTSAPRHESMIPGYRPVPRSKARYRGTGLYSSRGTPPDPGLMPR